jgi:hypothetical protein
MLHNRMWATDSNYSTANGGQYTFIDDGSDVLVPNDQSFWNDLIANKTKTGMFCYEQDWLDAEMDKSKTLGECLRIVFPFLSHLSHRPYIGPEPVLANHHRFSQQAHLTQQYMYMRWSFRCM